VSTAIRGGQVQSAEAELLGVRLAWSCVSDPGLVRRNNEDSVLADPGVFVVADGMGGHEAGEVASGIAVESLRAASRAGAGDNGAAIPQALTDAHRRIRSLSGDRTMGTTVTGLVLGEFGGQAAWLVWNVGDSRCYRIESGEIEQITKDHTLVAELLQSGSIRSEDASSHPDRHVITRAIGADAEVEADYWLLRPVEGERFVLCSDGLTNELTDDEILSIVAAPETPGAAAVALLSAALERGGHDNISAVVVFCRATTPGRFQEAEATSPRPRGEARTLEGVPPIAHGGGQEGPPAPQPLIDEVPT
jgi:protein phosphatase